MSISKTKLSAVVRKIIPPLIAGEAETVEISLDNAEDLYREIRIANIFTDQNGAPGKLRPGSRVDVIVEADTEVVPQKSDDRVSLSSTAAKKKAA